MGKMGLLHALLSVQYTDAHSTENCDGNKTVPSHNGEDDGKMSLRCSNTDGLCACMLKQLFDDSRWRMLICFGGLIFDGRLGTDGRMTCRRPSATAAKMPAKGYCWTCQLARHNSAAVPFQCKFRDIKTSLTAEVLGSAAD